MFCAGLVLWALIWRRHFSLAASLFNQPPAASPPGSSRKYNAVAQCYYQDGDFAPSPNPRSPLSSAWVQVAELSIRWLYPPAASRRRGPVEEQDACFVVRDHNGQQLAYVYFENGDLRPSYSQKTKPGGLLPTSPSCRNCFRRGIRQLSSRRQLIDGPSAPDDLVAPFDK